MKIETLQEYKNIVGGNTDKLVVVRFYAPWCKVRHRYCFLFYICKVFDLISNKKKYQDSFVPEPFQMARKHSPEFSSIQSQL